MQGQQAVLMIARLQKRKEGLKSMFFMQTTTHFFRFGWELQRERGCRHLMGLPAEGTRYQFLIEELVVLSGTQVETWRHRWSIEKCGGRI